MIPKIGAQTVTWKEMLREQMGSVVRFLADQGYKSVESGMRFFISDRVAAYRELYGETGIYPLGLHTGGKFWDPSQTREEMRRIGETIAFGAKVGFEYLVVSGNPEETSATMKKTAEIYGDLAKRCRDSGLKFGYHHHNWELKNGGKILKTLVDTTPPADVSLVLDIAWAHIAGWEIDDFMRQFGDRAAYLHIKDVSSGRFCELGAGEVDFDRLFASFQSTLVSWLIVEQDETVLTPEESLSRSMRFLRDRGMVKDE